MFIRNLLVTESAEGGVEKLENPPFNISAYIFPLRDEGQYRPTLSLRQELKRSVPVRKEIMMILFFLIVFDLIV
jgi:hypothetical protein